MAGLVVSAALAALSAAMPAPAPDDAAVLGRWNTGKRGGVVELHRCGAAICGRVVDGAPLRTNPDQRDVNNGDPALRSRRVMHLRVLHGFTGGPRAWKGGPLYDPETGAQAKSGTLTLEGRDTLKVKGCVAFLLCRTQSWTRAR